MCRHVHTTVGHFRGRVKVWDVVNEALSPEGGFADNLFFRRFGARYIDWCFRWAKEAGDEDLQLLYNDNKVEGSGMETTDHSRKGDRFYELVKGMVERGVPVDGVGMQAHFDAGGVGMRKVPSPKAVGRQIDRFAKLGLSVNLSEMDVRVRNLKPELKGLEKKIQRQIYKFILKECWSKENFTGVWFWGVDDGSSWVHEFYKTREGAGREEPLLIDDEFRLKYGRGGATDKVDSLWTSGEIKKEGEGGEEEEEEEEEVWGIVDGKTWWVDEDEKSAGGDENENENDERKEGRVNTDKPDWMIY